MSDTLPRRIVNLIERERFHATLDGDLAEVIEEWARRVSCQELVAALLRAVDDLQMEVQS